MLVSRKTPKPSFADSIRAAISRIEVLAFFPLLGLAALWWGETGGILATCFLLPALLAIQALRPAQSRAGSPVQRDGKTGLPMREDFLTALEAMMQSATVKGRFSACLVIEIDYFSDVSARWGARATDELLKRTAERLSVSLRHRDAVATLSDGRFAVALDPMPTAKLDVILALVDRIQIALSEPVAIDGTAMHPTVSIGFATPEQCDNCGPDGVLDSAMTALMDARRNGPSGIRGFSEQLKTRSIRRHGLVEEVRAALDAGDIRPWFQPQVSSDTGAITGFEALARWKHKDEGVLTPPDFLPAIEDAGLMSRLGEVILAQSLNAIKAWDSAGYSIPSVSVNFSAEELRDPTLADRVKWEVDRFDLGPTRLTVEILETVAAQSEDDIILKNIDRLSTHGFHIDLDDFGTGQSSIANIARFKVNRIKIDRSFVTKLDQEPTQRAVVAGILALAERLGVSTVAEGVETQAEQSILAQLGCDHLQGYGLSRPMPFEDTVAWIRDHRANVAKAPNIGRRAG